MTYLVIPVIYNNQTIKEVKAIVKCSTTKFYKMLESGDCYNGYAVDVIDND
jgi:hypothetical protein